MGRFTDANDGLPLGSVVELASTAAVVGDFVKSGEVLLKSEWSTLASALAGVPDYESLLVSASPSPAVGTPRYPFVLGGETYYSSSGTGLYKLYDSDKLKAVATTGLTGAAGRVAVLDSVAYCVINNELFKSTDAINWETVSDSSWYAAVEMLGATATDLYIRATVAGTQRAIKMAASTKVWTILTMPTGMSTALPLYPDGNVLVSVSASGTATIKVSRDAGVTWEDFKSLVGHSYLITKHDDGTVSVGNSAAVLSSQSAFNLSNDGWVTSFTWTGVSSGLSICKIGSKFALLACANNANPVMLYSVAAASTGSVASLDTDNVGTSNTWADELGNAYLGVTYPVNGKLAIATPEALIAFPAGAGNDLVLPAVAGRTVRPLPSVVLAVLWDGRVLTQSYGFFCAYDPDTGLFSGPARRVGAGVDFLSVSSAAQYLRGVALLNGDIYVYADGSGSGSASSITCHVLSAGGSVQTISVPFSTATQKPQCIQQIAADTVVCFSHSSTAAPVYKTNSGRAFTAIGGLATAKGPVTYGITKNKAFTMADADGVIKTTRDGGKTWTNAMFAVSGTTVLDISDKGVVVQFTSPVSKMVLLSLDNATQVGLDLPAGSYPDTSYGRHIELPGDFRLVTGNSSPYTVLRKKTDIRASSIDASPSATQTCTVKVLADGTFRAVIMGSWPPVYMTGKQKGSFNKTTQFLVPELTPSNAQLNSYVKGR